MFRYRNLIFFFSLPCVINIVYMSDIEYVFSNASDFILKRLRFPRQGVTSKAIAEDLHYGDISCQFNSTTLSLADLPVQCETAKNST